MPTIEPTNSELMNILVRIEQKVNSHDLKFGEIDKRFDVMDQKFNIIDQKFEGIDQRVEGIDQNFKSINKSFKSIDQKFEEMEQNHFDLVDFLKEHMVAKEELRSELGKLNHDLRDYIDRKIYNLRGDLAQIGVLKRI